MARMTTKRALAARKTWQESAENWRLKIKTAQIVNRLNRHALGLEEMKATEIKAATSLLHKVMPDLSSSELIKRTEDVDPRELINLIRQHNPELAKMLDDQYAPKEQPTGEQIH